MENMKTFKNKLEIKLDRIAEYHPDIAPTAEDTLTELIEKYFYWVSEYNDAYIPEEGQDTPFEKWIVKLWYWWLADRWFDKELLDKAERRTTV